MVKLAEQGSEKKEQRPQKSQRQILQHTEEAALTELGRHPVGLSLSGLSAGMDIGFSVLLMTVMHMLLKEVVSENVLHIIVSFMYPIGFIFVVLGRSELFTEHTTLACLPVLQGLASVKKLFRLWGIVYISNITGGFIFAFILHYLAFSLHFIEPVSLKEIAASMINKDWLTTIITAALAGWLMGLLAWLVAAARETISQVLIIVMIISAIGIIDLPHCIVGNIEVATSWFSGEIGFREYLNFLVPATLGNILGGVFFVAVIKFSHTIYRGEEKVVRLEK